MLSDNDERKVVFHLPRELDTFFKEQVAFLKEETAIDDPAQVMLDSMLEVLHQLTLYCTDGRPISIQGVDSFRRFSIDLALVEVSKRRPVESYTMLVPEETGQLLDDIKRLTSCVTDEEVMICGICIFRWILEIFKSHANIFLLYVINGESCELPYHSPLFELYKSRLFH